MAKRTRDGTELPPTGKFMSSVKVGPKGQIVIPKEVRTMFGIKPGDSLLLLADTDRGIAIQRQDQLDRIADEIFRKTAGKPVHSGDDDAELKFARAIRSMTSEDKVQ